jgi:colanic acid/amylovoran biosynthesis protein
MVATRYHGVVLSLALERPVLAIAYHDKTRDLMSWFGQGDYVIDGDSFSAEALSKLIARLETEGASISDSLRQQLPSFRSAVQAQYDEVFRLIGSHSRSG